MNPSSANAPELSDQLAWINSDPVHLGACAGRVVALLFFNQGSAYCHNMIEALQHQALKHPQQLQVVGLHVPKYPAERDAARVADALSRLGVGFPVASDAEYVAWQHYGIRGWPSLVLIDAGGQVRETIAGDVAPAVIDDALAPLLEQAAVVMDDTPSSVQARRLRHDQVLSHPGGLAVGERHLYIADSAHHQVLECNLQGRVLARYGTGHAELVDGDAGECAFDSPHGLLLHREALYIADTGNHALRRIDLGRGRVETVAGTGRAGAPDRTKLASPREVDLNRPWGLASDGERIFISLAGLNQVWAYELGSGALSHVAGGGQLGLEDGPALHARLAHPAGLAALQNTLYIIDAGNAALRRLSFNDGELRTLVGGGLFEFGAADGPRERASLQFPQGLALQVGQPVLWVADSGNDRLRTLRLGGGSVASARIDHALRRPSAIAAGDDALWLANTDQHQVLRLDVATGEVTEIEIVDAQA